MNEAAGPSVVPVNVVNQFKEVCGVETSVAQSFLRQSEWNLEAAIQLYFHAEEVAAVGNKHEHEPRHVVNNSNQQYQSSTDRHVANNTTTVSGLTGWLRWLNHYLITVPLELFYRSVTNVITFFYVLLGNHSLPITNPRDDVRRFLEDVVSRQPGHDRVSFVNGSYDDTLRRAKRNIQCVLVYIHSPSKECEHFLRSYLLTDRFCGLLQQNDALLWGVSTNTAEGKRVASSLKLISYPALALITCVPGSAMTCIFRLSGSRSVVSPDLFSKLQESFDRNRPFLEPLIRSRAEMERNSQLIREQEAEYARALSADRAKREVKLQREAEQKACEERERAEAHQLETKRQKLAQIRERIRGQIPSQPTSISDKNINGGLVCVRMKFPSGRTLTWNFDSEASLEELFNVVLTHESCPYDFHLVSGYPPEPLNCAPEWYSEFTTTTTVLPSNRIPTFAQSGFQKTAVVLVRDNDA